MPGKAFIERRFLPFTFTLLFGICPHGKLPDKADILFGPLTNSNDAFSPTMYVSRGRDFLCSSPLRLDISVLFYSALVLGASEVFGK